MWVGFRSSVPKLVVSPPLVFLQLVKGLLLLDFTAAAVHNCWERNGGAFTGEIRLLFPLILMCSGFGLW